MRRFTILALVKFRNARLASPDGNPGSLRSGFARVVSIRIARLNLLSDT